MQIGNAWIVLNANGSCTPRMNITPAEAQVLRAMFEPTCGSNPIINLEVLDGEASVITKRNKETGEVEKMRPRTDKDEYLRLQAKYGSGVLAGKDTTLKDMFPGLNPKLPETFEDAGIEPQSGWQAPDKSKSQPQTHRFVGPANDADFSFIATADGAIASPSRVISDNE